MITDIRYAMGQIRRLLPNGSVQTEDTCSRALDALDRVEAELQPVADVEPIGVAECPGCGRRCQAGHVCDLCSAG